MSCSVLIIDDEEDVCYSLKRFLERDQELSVEYTYSGETGIELYRKNRYDIVITDLILGKINGLEVIEKIKEINPNAIIIMITGRGSEDSAEKAIKAGAYDFFSKKFNNTEFFKVIRNAKDKISLDKIKSNYSKLSGGNGRYYKLFYSDTEMAEKIEYAKKVAAYDSTMLITGESGTGKGMLAESIHLDSKRNSKPFIKVNCGAIPDNLIESELFGYEKGAFTGAVSSKKGKIELADQGTLFLDEIGEIDIRFQAKLLRVIEEGVIEKVGSESFKKIDVRIIAATNVNLRKAISDNRFREDLFYRLNVFNIEMPPLRNRKGDIIYLSEIFLNEFTQKFGLGKKILSTELKSKLLRYSWPGNIRELKNIIENIVILSGTDYEISHSLFSLDAIETTTSQGNLSVSLKPLKDYVQEREREYIISVLEKCSGNKTETARILNLSRQNLYNKLSEYGIK